MTALSLLYTVAPHPGMRETATGVIRAGHPGPSPAFPAQNAEVNHQGPQGLQPAVAPARQSVKRDLEREKMKTRLPDDFHPARPQHPPDAAPGAEPLVTVERA
jgi:hypothetical protein